MEVYLIRHGTTRGNEEKRYTGRTDESLLPSEAERLAKRFRETFRNEEWLSAGTFIISPMKRCRETASLLAEVLMPEGKEPSFREEPDLRECDFGDFEYRNYEELRDEPAYQRFLDTLGESGFPGGESRAAFSKRCAEAFAAVCREMGGPGADPADVTGSGAAPGGGSRTAGPLIFVVHGGTIMAVMEAFARPHRDYYDWQVRPGEGFRARLAFETDESGRAVPVLTEAEPLTFQRGSL